ncbi:MAG: hypothetical protein KJ592_03505 [Nanoarchaeota archaeon]|nr:hypothetical protein [Nanoarchaeota archaeon]
MREVTKFSLVLFLTLITMLSLASAQQYSMDISGLNSDEYNPGEKMTFKIILLKDGKQITQQTNYKISDALKKKEITGQTNSNQETTLKIEDDFSSGIWTITATYLDSTVKRTFLVSEESEVEFIIEGDELIIRNTGNVRYTKTIQIKIGTETNTYVQNIKPGEEKVLKLISADGKYNIEVTDGTTTTKKENVQLIGVGNVVGAIDKELVGYTGFAGAIDPKNLDDRVISLKKLPMSLIFVVAVGILAALVFIERKMSKRKN